MYVNTIDISDPGDINALNYAQQVTGTYVYLLRTKLFYERVAQEGKLKYNANQLRALTTVHAIEDTEIFQINVTTNNAEDSYKIVKSMQEIAPKLIAEVKSSAKISVVDPVVMPQGPSGPDVSLNTMIGGFLGFMIAIVLSFFYEILDVNVKSSEELTRKYRKPVLGSIPNYHHYQPLKFKFMNLLPGSNQRDIKNNQNVGIDEEKIFEVSEAYNELRANLRFTLLKNYCKKIIISSPVPEDGKSTTSSNIAITIAQTGLRVLLMDCDLRKGKVHSFFDSSSKPGMSDVLSGMINEMDAVIGTQYENLYILPMGTIPPNPTELLGSSQMEEVMVRLEKNYDYIIIDSPPVNIVSDILSLSKMVDGIVIVVREKMTSHPNIANAITKYQLSDGNILGFVLNASTPERGSKSKSHYYNYKKKKEDL